MTPEIIYTNRTPKPTTPTSAPPASTLAPQPQRRSISWGIQGRLHMPATAERPQPQRGDRPSHSRAKVERSPEALTLKVPRVPVAEVDRYSKLERLPEQRLLCEVLAKRTIRPELEYLSILHSQRAKKYWIADVETGEVFVPQAFGTLEHCYEAAAELEHTFDMAQVLELRLPETLERVGEMVRECWVRERVAERLG